MAKIIQRTVELKGILAHKSLLLLGPRQSGKSFFLKHQFPQALTVDLLEADTFRRLSARPESLRQSLTGQERLIIIDEVQKLPELLDEAQLLIDRNPELRLILTGSSARKLKRGRANLLGGRALTAHMHPLTLAEVGPKNLPQLLERGGLPAIFCSPIATEELKAYIGNYLKEEIQAEGIVRSLGQFSRFLDVVALSNGEQINYTAVASDAEVKRRTVMDHFQVLYDTLLAYALPPFQGTKKRKPVATEKFYLFDVGIAHMLSKAHAPEPGSPQYGKSLEHAIFLELRAYLDYRRIDSELQYWRSQSQFEVDFIAGGLALEVKGKDVISDRDLRGMRALKEEALMKRYLCVSLEKKPRRTEDGIEILSVERFVTALWDGDYAAAIGE